MSSRSTLPPIVINSRVYMEELDGYRANRDALNRRAIHVVETLSIIIGIATILTISLIQGA